MREHRYRSELCLYVPNEKAYAQTVVVHAYDETGARRKINAWLKVKGHKSVSRFEIEQLPWPTYFIGKKSKRKSLDKVG